MASTIQLERTTLGRRSDERGVDTGLFVRLTVLDAFVRNPRLGWTPSSLSSWYGIRIDVVRRLLRELEQRGTIATDPGRDERYVLSRAYQAGDHRPGVRLPGLNTDLVVLTGSRDLVLSSTPASSRRGRAARVSART